MQHFIFIVRFTSLVFISMLSYSSLSAQNLTKDCNVLSVPSVDYDTLYCGRVIVNASFPGGTSAWLKYITNNIKYPQRDTQTVSQICIKIRFVVLKTGSVEDAQPIDGIHDEFTNEAIRLIKASPVWVPAMQNGRLVNESRSQTIIFSRLDPVRKVASACGDALLANIPIL